MPIKGDYKYDWDRWMDGHMWRLTPEDFPTTTRRHMMKMIFQHAQRHGGMKVIVKRSPGGGIVLQRIDVDPADVPAPPFN